MKNIRHRPCVICFNGHFKCNAFSNIRTCSKECRDIYRKNSSVFRGFPDRWYAVNDRRPSRRADIVRVGNTLEFKHVLLDLRKSEAEVPVDVIFA